MVHRFHHSFAALAATALSLSLIWTSPVSAQTPQVETPPPALAAEPAPPKMIYTPSMIAAPPPPGAGEAIAFDESKLDASAFMSRMSRTLARLRIDEDDDRA